MKRPFYDRLRQAASYAQVEYSQTAIARSLGTSKQTVDAWFKGGDPSGDLALRISERWGVDLHWLMTDEGEMVPPPIEDDLSPDERMILRSYRKAGPDWKRAMLQLARGVGKAVLLGGVIAALQTEGNEGVAASHNKNSDSQSVAQICAKYLTFYAFSVLRRLVRFLAPAFHYPVGSFR